MLKAIALAMAFMAAMPVTAMASENKGGDIEVKVTAGDHVPTATYLDNATTRVLIARVALTVPVMDLYSREVVYRLPQALPANEARTGGYEVGYATSSTGPLTTAFSSCMSRTASASEPDRKIW